MSSAARHRSSSASESPVYGPDSIFAHKMVAGHVEIEHLRANFPELYTLNDLTGQNTDLKTEHIAKNWFSRLLPQSSQTSLRVLDPSTALPELSHFSAFHSTAIEPDVTVVLSTPNANLPILTVEVLSGTSYERTVKKAIINVIEQFRILRVYDTSVGSCVGYVFPRNLEVLCVTKVRVTFHNFMFNYTLEHLCKGEVKVDITAAIGKWKQSHLISSTAPPAYPYFVRLSQEEIGMFESGGVQVESKASLIIRNHSSTKYWKFNPKHSEGYGVLAMGPPPSYSLVKYSPQRYGDLQFNEYQGLCPPFSREDAKRYLVRLLEQLKAALNKLHDTYATAHMDVRLPNICFSNCPSRHVMLIDLDRCEPSFKRVTAHNVYKKIDMYTPQKDRHGRITWMNSQLDWKAVGMLICFVLDENVKDEDYHCMISQNKVTTRIRFEPFVKCLLEDGTWCDEKWSDFKSSHFLHYSQNVW